MRQLKFRAYIKKYNKVFDVLDIFRKFPDEDFQRVFIDKQIEELDVTNYRIDGVENILMQYTGLKDKNGKEIYEGDILQWKEDNTDIEDLSSFVFIEEYIAWSEESLCFHTVAKDGYTGRDDFEDSEIIGNIYENPEFTR